MRPLSWALLILMSSAVFFATCTPAAPITEPRSPCPVQKFIDRHFCPGESTEENAMQCALARLRRWEELVQAGRRDLAGPKPKLVTVFTGDTSYFLRTNPYTNIDYCYTAQRQVVFRCRILPSAWHSQSHTGLNRVFDPWCYKVPLTCLSRHLFPSGHFDGQNNRDLWCYNGERT